MEASDWIAAGAVGVAVAGTGISALQARRARESAVAAKVSAEAANRQAVAAESQAAAAVDQLRLSQQQHEASTGPSFEQISARWFFSDQRYATAEVRVTGGPALAHIEVTASGADVLKLARSVDYPTCDETYTSYSVRNVGPGSCFQITAWVEWEAADPVRFLCHFACTGTNGETWDRTLAVSASESGE